MTRAWSGCPPFACVGVLDLSSMFAITNVIPYLEECSWDGPWFNTTSFKKQI